MGKEFIVTVFGSSRPKEGDADYEEARVLGRALARHGFTICSGGYGGVMEGASRGAKEAGGRTYGVTAEFFKTAKLNAWIDVEVRAKTWEERLFELIRRADACVACKGGAGTLVEVAVAWEKVKKSVKTGKPFAVVGHFWGPVLGRGRDGWCCHAWPWADATKGRAWRWSRANFSRPHRCWKRRDGCGSSFGKKRGSSRCWRRERQPLVIFEMCTQRSSDACCRTAKSATTLQRRCGAFERASRKHVRRSRKC